MPTYKINIKFALYREKSKDMIENLNLSLFFLLFFIGNLNQEID